MEERFQMPQDGFTFSALNRCRDDNDYATENVEVSYCITSEGETSVMQSLNCEAEDICYTVPEPSDSRPITDTPLNHFFLQRKADDARNHISDTASEGIFPLLSTQRNTVYATENVEVSYCIASEGETSAMQSLSCGVADICYAVPEPPDSRPVTDTPLNHFFLQEKSVFVPVPDLSQGLGKKQDNLNLVSLENFAAANLRLMVYQGELCEFSPPCWKRLSSRECNVRLRSLFHAHNLDFCITGREYKEIYQLLLSNPSMQQETEFPPTLHKLNLVDGTLDLKDFSFYSHDPKDGFFSYLNISRDELLQANTGPVFEQFVQDISNRNPDIRQQLLELIALAIVGYEAKVFYALLEPSNSGKTQFSRFLVELLGHEQVVNISGIQELGSKFAMANIEDKRLCLCPDLPDAPLPAAAIGTMKQAVGNDSIKIEAKYKNPKTIYKKPLYIFVGNHPIRVPNMSNEEALLNRMVIIPFAAAVPKEQRTENLYKALLAEAPYIVSQAIKAYRNLVLNHFSVTRTQVPPEYQPEDSRKSATFVTDFIQGYCILDEAAEISTNQFFQAYQARCHTEGEDPLSKIEFSRLCSEILQRYPSVVPLKRLHGQDLRGYRGIRLTE